MKYIIIVLGICVIALGGLAIWLSTLSSNDITVRTEAELINAIQVRAGNITIDGYIALSDVIEIHHHVTLRGQGTLTVSDAHRHFIIGRLGHLTLNGNIYLKRATEYEGYGGGIFIHDTWRLALPRFFVMRGGVIEDNTAVFSGGGIFTAMSTVELINGSIINNHAAGHGGVFSCASTYITVGHRMRIRNNTPSNRYDASPFSLLGFLSTPSIFHIIVVFLCIGVGIFYEKRSHINTKI